MEVLKLKTEKEILHDHTKEVHFAKWEPMTEAYPDPSMSVVNHESVKRKIREIILSVCVDTSDEYAGDRVYDLRRNGYVNVSAFRELSPMYDHYQKVIHFYIEDEDIDKMFTNYIEFYENFSGNLEYGSKEDYLKLPETKCELTTQRHLANERNHTIREINKEVQLFSSLSWWRKLRIMKHFLNNLIELLKRAQ